MKKLLNTNNLKKAVGILLLTSLSITATSSNVFAVKRLNPEDIANSSVSRTRSGKKFNLYEGDGCSYTRRGTAFRRAGNSGLRTNRPVKKARRLDLDRAVEDIVIDAVNAERPNTPTARVEAQRRNIEAQLRDGTAALQRSLSANRDLQLIENLFGSLYKYQNTNVATLEARLSYILNSLENKENFQETRTAIENILHALEGIDKTTRISIDIQIPKPEQLEQDQEIIAPSNPNWIRRHPVLTTGIVVGITIAGATAAYFAIPGVRSAINSAAHRAGRWGAQKLADLTGLTREHQMEVDDLRQENANLTQQFNGCKQRAANLTQQVTQQAANLTESHQMVADLRTQIQGFRTNSSVQQNTTVSPTQPQQGYWRALWNAYKNPAKTGNCFGQCILNSNH